jgi:predicted nucleotidyltransferase
LFKEGVPDEGSGREAAPKEDIPEEEPYMSYKRKRIIRREKNKELRENKAREVAEQKEAIKKAKEEAKATVTATKNRMAAEAKASKDDWSDFAKGLAERAKVRKSGG